jgi:small subunit ribosomal protein S14
MARNALKVKAEKRQQKALKSHLQGKKAEFSTRVYNRCKLCGRRHGYMRFLSMCRICFRKTASEGLIPGVTKSSW